MKKNLLGIFIVLSVFIWFYMQLLVAKNGQRKISHEENQMFVVERVVDGDTLKLLNGEKVRLIGIDTPESKPNAKAQRDAQREGKDVETITKMGQEATEFVKSLGLEGKEVRIEFDVQERDKYGRLLAYVFFPSIAHLREKPLYCDELKNIPSKRTIDGFSRCLDNEENILMFLNAAILEAGYASPMTIPPNVKYADLFKRLYQEARENKRGLWRKN